MSAAVDSSQQQMPVRPGLGVVVPEPWSGRAGMNLATFVIALTGCCLLGGSSKANVWQLLLLWPLLEALVSMQLWTVDLAVLHSRRPVPWLLAALAGVVALGLVVLPSGLWLSLPGRQRYAEALGQGGWATLSLVPDATVNSLLALVSPLVAILAMRRVQPRWIVWAIVTAGLASVMVGFLQIALGPDSRLYFYRLADTGLPVGWFANRNHQATLLASILPLLALIFVEREGFVTSERQRSAIPCFTLAAVLLVSGAILATGSRSGMVQLFLAVIGGAAIIGLRQRRNKTRRRWLVSGGVVAGLFAVIALFLFQSLALERAITFRVTDDLRFLEAPAVWRAVKAFFPVGTGFGSFDPVFRGFEEDAVLQRTFFNNAHNDVLETALCGGVGGLLVILAACVWWLSSVARCLRPAVLRQPDRSTGFAAGLAILIVASASLTDYPLRTPLMGFVFAAYCVLLETCTVGRVGAKRVVNSSQRPYQLTRPR